MKRKLALLLAGVMTLTMLPMNLFAASTNVVTASLLSAKEDTLLVSQGSTVTASTAASPADDNFSHVRAGTNLELRIDTTGYVKGSFKLTLNNANWYFAGEDTQLTSAEYATLLKDNAPAFLRPGMSAAALDLDNEDGQSLVSSRAIKQTSVPATFDEATSLYLVNRPDAPQLAIAAAYDGIFISSDKAAGYAYAMGVGSDGVTADVVLLDQVDGASGVVTLVIPMSIVTTSDTDPVTVSVSGNNRAGVSNSTSPLVIVANGGSGSTTATIGSATLAEPNEPLDVPEIVIKEDLEGYLEPGRFSLIAPSGFKFDANAIDVSFSNFGTIDATDLTHITFKGGDVDSSREIVISAAGLTASANLPGSIAISGLTILQDSSSFLGDVSGLRIVDDGMGIKDHEFGKIGTIAEAAISLVLNDSTATVPELFTGRNVTTGAAAISDFGSDMKVLALKLSENTDGSWWSSRDTKITFTEGVKVRGIKFSSATNVDSTTAEIDNGKSDNSHVSISKNVITLKNFEKDPTKKTSVVMEVYVSISRELNDKDIEVYMEGGGLSSKTTPVVVAKAVSPVTVEVAEVMNIRVGINQRAQNIIIKEVAKGALLEGKEINIRMLDETGTGAGDLEFVLADAEATITEGDIELSDLSIETTATSTDEFAKSSGYLSFTVDSASKVASTIVISGLQIRNNVDKAPAESIKDYRLFVYGDAIANNYGKQDDSLLGRFNDNNDQRGIFVDYLKMTGSGQVAATGEIVLSIGGGTYTFNGEEREITGGMVPFIDNDLTYVPVRLIGEAFLGNESAVRWVASTGTVVVERGSGLRVTFNVGDTFYTEINGGSSIAWDLEKGGNGEFGQVMIKNDRSFVPLRSMAYALGFNASNIEWDAATQSITISNK